MECLSIDFNGPLPYSSKNKYILTVVDEFSSFMFAFPCSNMESCTVISCLMQIFHLFGACGYIHSDRGKSFISQKFVSFMHNLRISTSKTSVYNPASNGKREKYNDIICSGIKFWPQRPKFAYFKMGGSFATSSAFRAFFNLYCYKFHAT